MSAFMQLLGDKRTSATSSLEPALGDVVHPRAHLVVGVGKLASMQQTQVHRSHLQTRGKGLKWNFGTTRAWTGAIALFCSTLQPRFSCWMIPAPGCREKHPMHAVVFVAALVCCRLVRVH